MLKLFKQWKKQIEHDLPRDFNYVKSITTLKQMLVKLWDLLFHRHEWEIIPRHGKYTYFCNKCYKLKHNWKSFKGN